jgi:hypothetical protein
MRLPIRSDRESQLGDKSQSIPATRFVLNGPDRRAVIRKILASIRRTIVQTFVGMHMKSNRPTVVSTAMFE